MFEVTITRHFSAAHILRDHPGKCARLHGHNWVVEITCGAEELNPLGMVVDFEDVKKEADAVIDLLDHRHLNEIPPFDVLNPTAENLALFFFQQLSPALLVKRVRVFETPRNVATYTPD